MFRRRKNKQKEAAAAAAAAPAPAPAEAPAAAPAPAQEGGDMFSYRGMNSAPSQGNSMNSSPAQGGDMFSGMSSSNAAPAPAPAPEPEQAAPQDPLMGARQKLMQISNQLRSEVVRLNEAERKMHDYIKSIDDQINGLENQLVEADTAEASALAVEDYAKAEEISTRSAAIKKEIESKRAEIQQCVQRNGQAMQQRVTKIQTELVTIDAMNNSFNGAYTHINTQFTAYVKTLEDQSAAHDARLASMMDKIHEKEDAVEKTKEDIAAEKEEVEKLIRADCEELYQEKDNATELKSTLDQEIASLKEQLHQKNQELLACTKRIADADQKIQQVRVKFLPKFQPIEEKNKGVATELKGIEVMKGQYQTAASRVEMVKKSADEDMKKKKEIVDTRKDEFDVINSLADALKKYDQYIIDHYQEFMTKQMKMLEAKKVLAENSIHSRGITNRMQVLEKTISDNHAIVEETTSKLPELEQQKVDAVASKNYKVAGQVTSQIKSLQSKKETASMAEAAAEEELNGIKASSSEELAALETKKAEYTTVYNDFMNVYYSMLRYNAIIMRDTMNKIDSITRGDVTFRFACQALASSIYDITKAELTDVATEAHLPELKDTDTLETAEQAAEQAADMFGMNDQPAEQASGDMFDMNEQPEEKKEEGLTHDRALELASIAEAQMEDMNNKLDAAMAEEKYDECDELSTKSEKLEEYIANLKKFASGEISEEPAVPDCFDVNFAVKASNGEDLFLGM